MTAFTLLVAALSALSCVRADVYPNAPAGDVYKTGGTCHIGWAADTNATTLAEGAWKDMTIELMTGDNFNMIHLTTVATGQDGTVAGSFDHVCPEVTINAPIYFYQFKSPHTDDVQWTTRFTIASASGQTVPAPNPTEPDGKPIPWGAGALTDPSTAIPAPVFTTAPCNCDGSSTTTSAFATSAPTTTSTTSTADVSQTQTQTQTSDNSTSSGTGNKNAALGSVSLDLHVMHAATVLVSAAIGFTILL